MTTFEVFIPVQGEVIFRVEADSHIEAQEIAMELDFTEGELNVDTDWSDEMRSEQIAGDDDDDDDSSVTVHTETFHPYVMRHFRR